MPQIVKPDPASAALSRALWKIRRSKSDFQIRRPTSVKTTQVGPPILRKRLLSAAGAQRVQGVREDLQQVNAS